MIKQIGWSLGVIAWKTWAIICLSFLLVIALLAVPLSFIPNVNEPCRHPEQPHHAMEPINMAQLFDWTMGVLGEEVEPRGPDLSLPICKIDPALGEMAMVAGGLLWVSFLVMFAIRWGRPGGLDWMTPKNVTHST